MTTGEAGARAARRRQRIAAGWKREDRFERMKAMNESDPDHFLEVFGPSGLIQLGLYEAGERAAAGDGPLDAA